MSDSSDTGSRKGAPARSGDPSFRTRKSLGIIVLTVIAGFVVMLWFSPGLLSGSTEGTRVFIALTFGAGIFIIAFMCLIILASQPDKDEAVARFNSAKEIFTALVAIFGTIIGFYFGTSQSEPITISPMEAGLIAGLSGLGVYTQDIPDDRLAEIGAIYFGPDDGSAKARKIKDILDMPAPLWQGLAEKARDAMTDPPVDR